MAYEAERYRRLSVKRAIIEVDVWFLNNCIKEKVTPVFARVKTSKNVGLKYKEKLEYNIIRSAICKHYAKIDFINCELKKLYSEAIVSMDNDQIIFFFNGISDEISREKAQKFDKLKSKLNNLIKQKNIFNRNRLANSTKFSDFKFHDRIKNLSNVDFDDDELDILRLGLKHIIKTPLSESDILELSVEIDVLIELITNNSNVKKSLRNDMFILLHDFKSNLKKVNKYITNSSFTVLKRIKDKIRDRDLILSKADKGNCLVILNKHDYINKVESFLSDNNFTVVNVSPFNSFIRKTSNMVKHFSSFFEENNAPFNLLLSNPSVPRLYGLPKIHKEGNPIRPVVSFTNTPTSNISSFVYNLIKSLTNFRPKFGVVNSIDLVNKLTSIQLPQHYLIVSFDVTNLFTTVPKAEAVGIVGNLLRTKDISENKIVDILSLLNFCLSQDFFMFNNKMYKQPDGLAMGSCLSPFLADIFMDYLENQFILSNNNNEILHWFRYVDDCLCILNCDHVGAENLLNKLNIIHPKISFTLEIEQSQKLNFLDLTIFKNDNKLEFSIYRKPTQTDHLIPFHSNHPLQHKLAAFNCYINRLLNIPLSKENYIREVNILKQLAYNNGYDPKIIPNLIEKTKYKKLKKQVFPNLNIDNQKYISVPFIHNSLNKNITKIFQKFYDNVRISYKTKNNLGSQLVNSKDKIDKLSKSGIYKLSCNSCNCTYVGRTCRSLKVRINEHLNRSSSAFGNHLKDFNHNFSPHSNSKILHHVTSKNYNRLDFLEDIEITNELKTNNSCVNTQVNLNRSFIPLHRRLTN